MKAKRTVALVLAVVMTAGVLTTGILAADIDGQSQATPKAESDSQVKEKPQTDSTQDDSSKTESRSRKGCKKEETAEPEGAIGKDRAKEIALADAGVSAEQTGKVRSRITETDGTVIYKVRFTYDGQRYSYRIDAMSGEILDKTTSAAEEKQAKGGKSRSRNTTADEQSSSAV